VRIHNTNTQKILVAEVPVREGMAVTEGAFAVPGVPGTGAMIKLDFSGTAGSATGRLIPTGNPTDMLEIEGIGEIEVTLADASNPVVFVRAEDVGAKGTENRLEINGNKELMEKLEKIRAAGAEKMGLVKDRKDTLKESPLRPQIAFVRAPVDYVDYGRGELIKAKDIGLVSRIVFNQMAVEAYTGTGSVCTAATAVIEGTIPNQVLSEKAKKTGMVGIGHPRGIMELEAKVTKQGTEYVLEKAIFRRTARRLMEGYAYVKRSRFEG
jgi:2-methylaconitate cis-trans-isomerase PrpF